MATPAGSPDKTASFLSGIVKVMLPVVAVLLIVMGGLFLLRSRLPSSPPGAPAEGSAENAASPSSDGSPGGSGLVSEGAVLPDFGLTPYTGPGANPGGAKVSQLNGKVTLINFWATWCEACMAEMPSLVQLYNGYKDKGFQMIAVNLDENPETVLPHTIQQLKIGFPIYLDAGQKLSELFDVHAIPLTVIMDSKRRVIFIENGERNWNSEEIRSKIEQWLAG